MRTASLSLLALCLMLAAVPAVAGTLYENGPINGTVDAWTINFGFGVADTFTISGGNSTITGMSFGAWLLPGDTLQSVEVSITSQPFSGTTYFDGIMNVTQSGCALNEYSYNVCTETGSFNGPALGNGTYWVGLQNGVVTNGDPVYWDQNSGIGCQSPGCPSQASNGGIGSLPSESFTILGNAATGTTPEPASLALFASGVLGVGAVVRRKMRKAN
jgi:hypothetical protein